MIRVISLVLSLLPAAITCLGQGIGNDCSLAGTWYGVGDGAKYLMTIIPIRGNEYATIVHPGFKPKVPALAAYSGVTIMKSGNFYTSNLIALANTSDLPPLPGSPSLFPQIWAVRSLIHLLDCNTLHNEIVFWGAYLSTSNKVPFQDAPDAYLLQPPATEIETYRRMPKDCAICVQ